MSVSERVEFAARDGVKLRGDFYRAEGTANGVIVMLNGFGLPKEPFNSTFAQRFQAAGISALNYDNRNYGSSDGTPRQEVNLLQQAADFHDAISAAVRLPGVDPAKVVMYGIGHGGSVAMIAAGHEPRLKAVIMHAPFPSGRWDALGFPAGTLERAWADRDAKTRAGDASPTYVKYIRDWEDDKDGDDASVMIKGKMGHMLYHASKTSADAAGTPWNSTMTLQSFINLVGIESQDYVYKITAPALYIVHHNDPFSPSPEFHRKVYSRMGLSADFKVTGEKDGSDLMTAIDEAIEFQISWLKQHL